MPPAGGGVSGGVDSLSFQVSNSKSHAYLLALNQVSLIRIAKTDINN
jgi:hypothetical protein